MSESWVQVITLIGSNLLILLTFFGTTIALHMQANSRIDAIHNEIRDFHARLCEINERTKKH